MAIGGVKVNKDRLKAISDRVLDLTPVLDLIADDLEVEIRQRFADEEDFEGNSWAPLAESTIKAKGHDAILRDTDELYSSIFAELLSETSLQFGTTVDYGSYHHLGTKTIEARPFLPTPMSAAPDLYAKYFLWIRDFVLKGELP